MCLTLEKFRGFIADHQATIIKDCGNHFEIELSEQRKSRRRRSADRPLAFRVQFRFQEVRPKQTNDVASAARAIGTKVHCAIRPVNARNRRVEEMTQAARDILISFRSYLMATEEESPADQARPSWLAD